MTPEALRAALGRLELSQGAAARLLGVDARTMRRWLAGDRAIPEIAIRLLGVIEHIPKARRWLERVTE